MKMEMLFFFYQFRSLLKNIQSVRILLEKDKQKDGKRPKRRSAIAKKRQGDANHRSQANGHTYIDYKVEKKYWNNPITINSAEDRALSLSQPHNANEQGQKK